MVLVFKIVGLILLLGGLTAVGLGWPYRMIDWGNIQVLMGGFAIASGLLLAALGVLLGDIRQLRAALLAQLNRPGSDDRPAQNEESASESVAPVPASLPVASAAIAAAGAIAIAANRDGNSLTVADADGNRPTMAEEAFAPVADALAAVPPDDRFRMGDIKELAEDGLVWIKPEDRPAGLSVDALTARINEAAGDLTALRRGVTEGSPDPVDRAQAGAGEVASEEPVEQDDMALLAGAIDREIGVLQAENANGTDPAEDERESSPPIPDPVVEDDTLVLQPTAVPDQPVDSADASLQPAANGEGVVSVHKVGDATFTMYVDGTIRAETPDGTFGFSTVAELKAYLAGDTSVARPLA